MDEELTLRWDKPRGLQGCLVDGWRIFVTNRKIYFKHLALFFVLFGMALAFLFEICVKYGTSHLLPSLRLKGMEGLEGLSQIVLVPTAYMFVYLLLALLLALLFKYWLCGRVMNMVTTCAATNRLTSSESRVCFLSLDDRQKARRFFTSDLLFALVFLAFAAVVSLLAEKISRWLLLSLPVVYVYLVTAANQSALDYSLGRRSFAQAVKHALGRGWGKSFVVQLLMEIPVTVCCLVLVLLPWVYLCVKMAAADSVLLGDEPRIPDFLVFLFFVFNSIAFALCAFLNSLKWWPLALRG